MFNEAEQSSLDELVIKVRKIIFFEILPIIYEELNPFGFKYNTKLNLIF